MVVADPSRVAALRRVADGLTAALPGVRSCPADFGTRYRLAFAPSVTAGPALVYTADNCGDVQVSRSGRELGNLAEDTALSAVFARSLGT